MGKVYVEDENNFISYIEQPASPYLTSYYVEDEDNIGMVPKRGDQYNADTDLYTRSGGVYCYETSGDTYYVGGSTSYSTIYVLSNGIYSARTGDWRNCSAKTLYTRRNGATRYKTTKVSTPLYTSGGTHTYPLYTQVRKDLYAAGTRKVLTYYKEYTKPLYDQGVDVAYTPASFITRNATVLKA